MQHPVILAIQTGDIANLQRLLAEDPTLVHQRLDGKRTLLHVATDWPGHFPNVQQSIATLVAHGADVNAKMLGQPHHSETPLQWAASSDDIAALDALIHHGADIEATGAVIGGGTPMADAVAFRNWRAAQRLAACGALTTIWQAAALGQIDQLEKHLSSTPPPSKHEITNAFWSACHGGQLVAAQRLLTHGADLNWIGFDHKTPLDAAYDATATDLIAWLRSQGSKRRPCIRLREPFWRHIHMQSIRKRPVCFQPLPAAPGSALTPD